MHRSVAIDLSIVTRPTPHKPRTERACSIADLAAAKSRRAVALSIALVATQTSNVQLARALGVDERIVRDLRAGRRPLTDERVALFGQRLRAAYDAALREGVQLPLF